MTRLGDQLAARDGRFGAALTAARRETLCEGDVLALALTATGSGQAEAEAKQIADKVSRWTYAIPLYKANQIKTKLSDLLEPAKGS